MSSRTIAVVIVVLAILGAVANYVVWPMMSAAPGKEVASGPFSFVMTRNEYGDRVLLRAPVHISFFSQPTAPDRVELSSRDGTYDGVFLWTLVPGTTANSNEVRLLGEFGTGGRTYRVCELLRRGRTLSAARFSPINNDGPKYRDPEQIDPTQLGALLDTMIAEEAALSIVPKGHTDSVSVSPGLVRMATSVAKFCVNQVAATVR